MIDRDLQRRLLYCCVVAGKNARFAAKAVERMSPRWRSVVKPFDTIRWLAGFDKLEPWLRQHRTGQYRKLTRCLTELAFSGLPDRLGELRVGDLQQIHGIGPKTERFFLQWCGIQTDVAVLDVHVLRWLRQNGYPDAPRQTPSGSQYLKWEQIFLDRAWVLGVKPEELDATVWQVGSEASEWQNQL